MQQCEETYSIVTEKTFLSVRWVHMIGEKGICGDIALAYQSPGFLWRYLKWKTYNKQNAKYLPPVNVGLIHQNIKL